MLDLTGQRKGRLLVVCLSEKRANRNELMWECLCDCGERTVVSKKSLSGGHTTDCGCVRKRVERHGKYNSPEYGIWKSMRDRCKNPKSQHYESYGGRGIKVYEEWDNSFLAFLNDMGERPGDNYSLDRIDNDGSYTPTNCRWTSQTTQVRNRRIQKNNTSGVSGVRWVKERQKWVVRIKVNGKNKHIGIFLTLEEATTARERAEEKYWKNTKDVS